VSIDPGELMRKSIHIEKKKVIGLETYGNAPLLVQISENKVWASFYYSDEIWIGEITGNTMLMTKHPDYLPMLWRFRAPPLRLPDGRFLAAGGYPYSTDISLITPGEHFSFEKIGDIPGEERDSVSTILIGERFVVGFGGWHDKRHMDDMWIFDLETHKISSMKREGGWHPGGSSPVLAVRDKELYVIGGGGASSAHCISFLALSRLIQYGGVRRSFCLYLGLPFRLSKALKGSIVIDYIPTLL